MARTDGLTGAFIKERMRQAGLRRGIADIARGRVQSALAERDWLVNDRFSVADVMCASVLQGANARELLGPWPDLEAYVQRGEARPAYARAAAISDRPRA